MLPRTQLCVTCPLDYPFSGACQHRERPAGVARPRKDRGLMQEGLASQRDLSRMVLGRIERVAAVPLVNTVGRLPGRRCRFAGVGGTWRADDRRQKG